MSVDLHTSLERQQCSTSSASSSARDTRRRASRGARVMLRTLVAAGALLVLGMQAPALAAYPPPPCNSLTVSATSVAAGGTVTVSGCGFAAGSTVTIGSAGQVLGTVVADSTGAFSTTVTLPANLAVGARTLTATGTAADGTPLVLSASVSVTAASSGGSGIAFSGSNTWPTVLIAGGLLLVGAVLVMTVRRRHSTV